MTWKVVIFAGYREHVKDIPANREEAFWKGAMRRKESGQMQDELGLFPCVSCTCLFCGHLKPSNFGLISGTQDPVQHQVAWSVLGKS